MNKIGCPKLLEFWSPDDVAECLGVSEKLYIKIWNEIVPLVEKDKNEDPAIKKVGYIEYPDQQWGFCVKRYWDKFTDEEKQELVESVEKYEREIPI